ncbi:hypothetical protein Tco_0123313 [Tanacetum coccineum]
MTLVRKDLSTLIGKRQKEPSTHKPKKTENTILKQYLNTPHMDLCGSMRVQIINGKRYILVIVDDYSRFNSDVDEAPTAQTMFMANLSSADPVYDKVGPSYDLDILSEYVKDNAVPVVQSNISYVPNDAYMMIFNDMHEPHAQSVSDSTWNTVVDNSLITELATYKEQVELYERRARFELTEREQKIDEQLRIVITNHNIKEENLKKERHSVKMQLASTINHNKSIVEEVTSLKKGF